MTEPWRIPVSREHEEKGEWRGCGKLGRFKPIEPIKRQGTKGVIKILRH